jgi:hypothetical protein
VCRPESIAPTKVRALDRGRRQPLTNTSRGSNPVCDLRQLAGICDGQALQQAHAVLFPDVREVS